MYDEFSFGSYWCHETVILLYINTEALRKILSLKTRYAT
jgi:hypothetical protein